MNPRPLISVAMPVFNVESTILEAVESIRYQTLTDWELIVIDDGSTDRTREVLDRIRDPRIRIIPHDTNFGLGQRLNEAVTLARGEFFARMDGDDVSYPDRLATQLDYLQSHPHVDVVGSWLTLLDADRNAFGTWRPPAHHEGITRRLFHSVAVAHPTYFGRREWFARNPYLPEFVRMEDQILLMHTAEHSTFANIQRALVGYRQPDTDVRSSLRRRVSSIANAARFYGRRKQYFQVARNVASNAAVGAVECLAEVTRLGNRLLVHRVGPLTTEQRSEWEHVHSAVRERCDPASTKQPSAKTPIALPLPAALIVGHPGHELRLFEFLERAQPLVCVLTDGSGSGRSRIASSHELLEASGSTAGPVMGAFSDEEMYDAMIRGDVSRVATVVESIAAMLVKHRVRSVIADAIEFYNPTHDLCAVIATLAAACAQVDARVRIQRYDYAVTQAATGNGIVLELDEADVERKIAAAYRFENLTNDVNELLANVGRDEIAREVIRPIDASIALPALSRKPHYEIRGEERVLAGRYRTVLRYEQHFVRFVDALAAAVGFGDAIERPRRAAHV